MSSIFTGGPAGGAPSDLSGIANSSLTSGKIPVAGASGVLADGPAYAAGVLDLVNASGTASLTINGQVNSTVRLYMNAAAQNWLIQAAGASLTLRYQYNGATISVMNSTGARRYGDANAPSVTLESAGAVGAATYVKSGSYTVATLPAAATAGAGARAMVTDANATTFMSTVAGGGSNIVPVVSDGTNWKIG